jgi:hypothetical protein
MRRAAKVDATQAAIVSALRAAGAGVLSLAALGRGVPDLLIWYRGGYLLLECKDGAKPPSHRKLTQDQQDWMAEWPGEVHVVLSPADALKAIGATA